MIPRTSDRAMWILVSAAVLAVAAAGFLIYTIVARPQTPNGSFVAVDLTGRHPAETEQPREKQERLRMPAEALVVADIDATPLFSEASDFNGAEQGAGSRSGNERSSAAPAPSVVDDQIPSREITFGDRTHDVVDTQPLDLPSNAEGERRVGFSGLNERYSQTELKAESETSLGSEFEAGSLGVEPDGPVPAAEQIDLPAAPAAPAVPAVPHTPESPPIDRLVIDFAIGASHPDPRRRMVGWNLLEKGWAAFVNGTVEPYLDAGVLRIMLHNPFGMLPDEPMQLDQYLVAKKQPGLRRLTVGFVDAWLPVTERGIEVMAYVGCPRLDDDAKEIEARDGRAAGLTYAMESLAPFIEAGMTIGLDASSPATVDSLTWDLAVKLRDMGVKVYTEARPPADQPQWFDHPVITTDPFWIRSSPERYPDHPWGARADQLTGEILRMVIFRPVANDAGLTQQQYDVQIARRILAEGHTVVMMGGSGTPVESIEQVFAPENTANYD